MTKKFQKNIGWERIDGLDDCYISFLLYEEGKAIHLISKIRNLPVDVIKSHIIECKSKINPIKKALQSKNASHILTILLGSTKKERTAYLNECDLEEKNELVQDLMSNLASIENAEDKMIALWIAGEIKDPRLLPLIHAEIEHKHGGVRRMVCSSLGKIGHRSSINVLHRSLQDSKPQVRQYAAKALANIGDQRTIKRIKNLMNNPRELDYVKRAYSQAMNSIEERLDSTNKNTT